MPIIAPGQSQGRCNRKVEDLQSECLPGIAGRNAIPPPCDCLDYRPEKAVRTS
jgi:hypothetical protein